MQRQSAAFPRDSAGAAAFEEILALVAGDRGARPFGNGFEPWTARGGLQTALEKNVLSKARLQPPGRSPGAPLVAWIVDSRAPGRARDRTPPSGSASFAIQPTSAAPGEPKEPTSLCVVLGALSGAVFRIGP